MYEIILAAPEDFPRVRAMLHSLIDEMQHLPTFPYWEKGVYPTDEAIRSYIDRGGMHLLTEDGEIAGTVCLHASGENSSAISMLAVHPQFARRGYAKALLSHALSLSRAAHSESVQLDVTDNNLPAQRLYEGTGFRPAGETTTVFDDGSSIRFLIYECVL